VSHPCLSITSGLDSSVESYPQRTAVVGKDGRLTYTQLRRAVRGLAEQLVAEGAPGTTVAVMTTRGSAQLVAALATMWSGAAFACIDRGEPVPRRRAQLAASGARIVVTDDDDFDFADLTIVRTDLHRWRSGANEGGHRVEVAPNDPAYIVFTSGSTGTPKAVRIPHRALANYAQAAADLIGGRRDGGGGPAQYASFTSMATDLGHTAIFPALLRGHTVHLVPWETMMDPADVRDYVRANAIDVMKTTPSHLSVLLDIGGKDVLPRETLILGGEGLPWQLADQVRELGQCRLINHYGPSETTVGLLTYEVRDPTAEHRSCRYVPVGQPLAGNGVAVVDSSLVPVPDGLEGELLLSGEGVALGYLDNPALTDERFVADPFAAEAGRRAYRSGDVGRRLTDGNIEFLHRLDRQVKVHGHRVELGEVEYLIKSHPLVRNAAVRLDPDSARLEAYVVTHAGLTAHDLRGYITSLAPPQFVPSRLQFVDALPLTLSGKLDEAKLRARACGPLRTTAGP
jgi:amino acid adenylation domain-containing protein